MDEQTVEARFEETAEEIALRKTATEFAKAIIAATPAGARRNAALNRAEAALKLALAARAQLRWPK